MTNFSIASLRKLYKLFIISVQGTEKEFTTGSINKAIFMLSIPMILEMVMESLFAVVDVFYVSQVGTNAVATVGLTESMITLVYSVSIGLSMAVTAMVARRVGEKNTEAAGTVAFQAMIVGVVVSLLIGVVGIVYAKDMLALMGAEPELIEEGWRYTAILIGGNMSIMMLFLINAIFRGAGDASIAMRSLWIANGLNLVLDPIFIFGFWIVPAYGVEGAAIATTIGRSVGVLYQLSRLFGNQAIVRLTAKNFVVQWTIMKSMLKLSAGGMGQFLIESASWIFLIRVLSVFGSDVLAGYTIAVRVIIFGILPSWGMANAAATLVGQNLGAREPERAETSVWRTAKFNMIFLGLISLIFILGAEQIMLFFTSTQAVVGHGVLALQVICLGYVFFAYGMVVSQAFNGAGDTKTPTVINVVCFWIIQIPLSYLLAVSLGLGPLGVFVSIAGCHSLHAIIAIIIFQKGKWKEVVV
ncbi:MAG: MATE family efflux transporter [Cyclobacteriaceae bacterium]